MRPSTAPAPASHRESAAPAPSPERCVSCGEPAGTPYCPRCGERRAADRRYSLAEFGAEAVEAFTSADNRLFRTLVTLARRPGELTAAYVRGQRRPYLAPLQLFLLVNVAYFLYASVVGPRTFDTPLDVHMSRTMHGTLATQLVAERLAVRGSRLAEYRAVVDAVSTTQAKSLVIVMVPPFACLVAVVTARRRSFVQALVFALHTYAVVLLVTAASALVEIATGGYARLRRAPFTAQQLDDIVSLAIMATMVAYMWAALRRAYASGRAVAAVQAVALFAGIAVLLFAYRVLLFFTTFWAT